MSVKCLLCPLWSRKGPEIPREGEVGDGQGQGLDRGSFCYKQGRKREGWERQRGREGEREGRRERNKSLSVGKAHSELREGEKEERDGRRITRCYGSSPWSLSPKGEDTGHLWAGGG